MLFRLPHLQSGPPQLLRSSLHMAINDGAKWSDIVRENPNMTDAISERVRSSPTVVRSSRGDLAHVAFLLKATWPRTWRMHVLFAK